MNKNFYRIGPAAICLAALLSCARAHAAINVIDYYRLGDADAGAANGAVVNATSQDSAGTKHLTRIGSPTYTSDVFSGATLRAGSQLAVSFNGSGRGYSNAVVSTATDNFGIEAWVRTKSPTGNHSIVYNGNTSTSGWGIYQFGGTYGALFGGVIIFGSIPAAVNDWAHLALVRASGVTILYLNGTPAATNASNPNVPAGGFCIGLPGQGGGTENFNGDIDEVRVFTFTAGQFSTNDLLVNAPAGVSVATMNDTLQTDVNGNGRFNPGDTLRYTVVITNNTSGTLSNVVFNSSAVPNAPQVGGSLKAAPLARSDSPATNSAPGSAFHAALNSALNIPAGSGLLANDFVGVPAAAITSFGGGSFGGSVTANAAGVAANNPAVGSLTVNADGSLTFTPATGFNGTTTFQYRLANSVGTNDASVTLAIGVRPSAINDTLSVSGNTLLDSSLIPLNLLGNDAGDLVGVSSIANPSFGTFSFSANGNFIFTPNVGASGAANVNYTITNGFGSATGQIVMTLGNEVWYIDGASVAGAADGRSHTPFKTIAAFNAVNNGVANNPGDNDVILLRDGTYSSGITLRLGQRLIGDGSSGGVTNALGVALAVGSAIAPGVPIPAFSGTDPIIESAAGNAVTLNTNNTIRGLTAGNTPAGVGFTGGAVGTLNISESSKTGSGGGININTSGALNVSFDNFHSTSAPGAAINLTACSGNFTVAAGTISAPASVGVNISGASTLNFTFPGNITKNSAGRIVDIQHRSGGTVTLSGTLAQNAAGGTGINVANCTGGTVVFSGTSKVLNTSGNTAVSLVNNTGTTINFTSGSLSITTTGTGFNATGGGTISVTGTANIISSGNGTALNVVNTTIGASGLTFQSITSSGGSATGIILDGSGSGGLTVTGTGTPGTGGTIANKTGGDGAFTTGNGIYLNSAANIRLASMQLNDFQNSAIRGFSVTGFTLKDSVISGVVGTSTGEIEGAIAFGHVGPAFQNGLFGNSLIDNVNISGSIEHQLEVYNQSGTMNLTVTNANIHDNSVAGGSDGIQMEFRGTAQVFTKIDGCSFSNNKSQAIQISSLETANVHATIRRNTVTRGTQGNEGIVLSNGGDSDFTTLIGGPTAADGNTISGFGGVAIFVGQVPGQGTPASLLQATIQNNNVTSPPTASNHGIIAFLSSLSGQISQARLLIDTNTVTYQSGAARAILVDAPDASRTPEFHATVRNNLVTASDINAVTMISVAARNGAIGHSDIRGNDVNFTGGASVSGVNVREATLGSNVLARGGSASNDAATVIAANNPLSTTAVLPSSADIPVVENHTILLPATPTLPTLP